MDFATTLVDPAEGGPSAPFPSVFTLPARVVHAPGTPAPVSEVGDAAESSATAAPAPSARARRGLRTGVIPPFTHTTTDRLVDLSIVVPAYNEQGRLPAMMEQTLRHLLLAAGEDPVEGASAEELRAAHDTRRALANATAFLQGVPYFVEAGPAGPSPRCTPPPAHVTVFNRRAAAEPTAQPGRRTKPIYRHARAADASTAAEADLAVSDLHLTMPNSHGTHVFSFEVVIVDDGSADATAHVARSLTSVYTADRVRLLRLPRNVGKGGAVAAGVLRSRGRLILFADADGATDLPTALPRMVDACVEQLRAAEDPGHGMALAVGSRAASGSGDARVERAPVRAFLQHAFQASLAAIGGVGGVADTQCGFKLATRPAARLLYPQLHLETPASPQRSQHSQHLQHSQISLASLASERATEDRGAAQ
ncbi:hypothetical protein H696_00513 [Fonticula alba]|uniref:Glycosyltransferase 2-like domain-containing protein n=1 Tax=Fonticula alba TaxID=691883 RepID=A0A058ZF41_FONAL|nr:hypothetical protein H696_00513 [Fonticula alba]KCV72959.1 hypothetical protein H696_00513 [Fonticula alba]|eukprot:XP_009492660.1 hypothetical protein H696_00513 [Fonticula alba]